MLPHGSRLPGQMGGGYPISMTPTVGAIVSCQVRELPGHGYSLRAVTLTGLVLVVPLALVSAARLAE